MSTDLLRTMIARALAEAATDSAHGGDDGPIVSGGVYRLADAVLAVLDEYAQSPASADARAAVLVSTSQAADILGVGRATVVRFLNSGRLPYSQPGKHRRVRLADVLAFKESITHVTAGSE